MQARRRGEVPRSQKGNRTSLESGLVVEKKEVGWPILIVEDDERTLEFLRSTVKQEFPQVAVLTATNGEEALKEIDREQPQLMLLNLIMPRKTGYEVLSELHEKGKEFPILVISGYTKALERTRTSKRIQSKNIDYLAKPFPPEELIEKIHGLLLQ